MGSSDVGNCPALQSAPELLPGGRLVSHVVTVTEDGGDASVGTVIGSWGPPLLHLPGLGPLEAGFPSTETPPNFFKQAAAHM